MKLYYTSVNKLFIANSKKNVRKILESGYYHNANFVGIELIDKSPNLKMFLDAYDDNINCESIVYPKDEKEFVEIYGVKKLPKR